MSRHNNGIQAEVEDFLRQGTWMSLCTNGPESPWCTPVYYVHRGVDFYFFSSPESRHIQDTRFQIRAAAAITGNHDRWEDIRSVQMSGRVLPVPTLRQKAAAVRLYLRKFPFVDDFLFQQELRGRFFAGKPIHWNLYTFQAAEIYYLDNRRGFGSRVPVFPQTP